MYLKRKVDAFLEEWKADKNRKPLIVKGSRQIGKTESILHFAADHYENVIEINFVRDEKYKGIIADGYEAADIIKNISLIDPTKKFVPEGRGFVRKSSPSACVIGRNDWIVGKINHIGGLQNGQVHL